MFELTSGIFRNGNLLSTAHWSVCFSPEFSRRWWQRFDKDRYLPIIVLFFSLDHHPKITPSSTNALDHLTVFFPSSSSLHSSFTTTPNDFCFDNLWIRTLLSRYFLYNDNSASCVYLSWCKWEEGGGEKT